MSKEYIERGALIAEYDRVHVGPAGGARKLMVDAPAADVVEVVRCKDCIYAQEIVGGLLCMCGDIKTSYGGDIYPDPDDFCSHGERKEQK